MQEPEQATVNFNFVRNRASELLRSEMKTSGFGEIPISWADEILAELLAKDIAVEDVNFDALAVKLVAALSADKGPDNENN